MIIFLILFLTIIYIKFGLFYLIQIMLLLIVFLTSQFLIGINPWNIEYRIIRFMSIVLIFAILYYNSKDLYSWMFIIPLSKDKISLYENLPHKFDFDENNFKKWKFNEDSKIEDFLKTLNNEDNFVCFLETYYRGDIYYLAFSELFLFNKFSNHKIIEDYISSTINDQLYLMNLDPMNFKAKKLKLVLHYTKLKMF